MGIINKENALYMATGIDNSGLKQDAAEAERLIEGVGESSEKAGAKMKKSFASIESTLIATRETITVLNNTITSLNAKLDSNASSSSADAKKIAELEAALADLKIKYDNLNKSVPNAGDNLRRSGNDAKKAASDYDALTKSLNNAWRTLGIGFSAVGLKNFASEIINVRGEMQMLESSFEVLLKGKNVSGFLAELKQFAVESPLSLRAVSQGAQILLGFNVPAEKVIYTLRQLGDVTMSDQEKFQRMIMTFSQIQSLGKLTADNLRELSYAGFNPLIEMSQKTGKTIGELRKDMESGAISAEMVADALKAATSEGGRFYGMTQKQAEGIKGLQAKLEGGLIDAYNKIGDSQNEIITGGYKMTIGLVENYETVGKSIIALVATYGTYRAALITVSALEAYRSSRVIPDLAMQSMGFANATKTLTFAQWAQAKSQAALNAVSNVNPYVLIATAVIGLGAAMWALHDSTTSQEMAQKRLNEINDEAAKKKEDLATKTNELVSTINSETKATLDKIIAYKELQGLYPSLLKDMDMQTFKALSTTEQQKLLNSEMAKMAGTDLSNQIAQHEKLISSLKKQLELSSTTVSQYGPGIDLGAIDKKIKAEEIIIEKLKQENEERKQATKEAEVRNRPEQEQIKWLKEQLAHLDGQKQRITDVANLASSLPAPFQSMAQKARDALLEIAGINTQVSKLSGWLSSLTGKGETKNKAFYEKQKKDAEDALALMDKSEKGTKAWNEQLKKLQEAQLALKAWSFVDPTKANKAAQTAAERANAEKVAASERIKQIAENNDKIKAALESSQTELTEANTNSMEEGYAKEKQKIDDLYQKRKDEITKRTAELIKTAQENEKLAWVNANPDYKKKGLTFTPTTTNASQLTGNAQKELSNMQATADLEKATRQKALLESLLSKYQDYTAKRTELEKKYNDDVKALEEERADAMSKHDSATVIATTKAIVEAKKQFGKSVGELDFEQLQKSIDWEKVFGNLEEVSTRSLKSLRDKLSKYLSDSKNLSPDSIKAVSEALQKMDDQINNRNPFEAISSGLSDYHDAARRASLAQEQLNRLTREGLQGSSDYAQAESDLTKAETDKKKALKKASDGINQVGKDGQQYVGAANDMVDALEMLGVKVDGNFKGYIAGTGELMNGLAEIDLTKPGTVITGGVKMLKGAIQQLTSVLGMGGLLTDYSAYNKLKEQYDGLIDIWDQLIDKKKEYISIDYGDEARKAGQEALDLLNKQLETTKKLADARLGSGSGIGSHSIGYRMWQGSYKSVDGQNWQDVAGQISSELGIQFKGMSDMLNMTSDQLLYIKENYSALWAVMDGDFKAYLEDIIAYGDEVKKINDSIKESFTGITFDSFYDNFVDTLADMDSDSADFAENFGKYLQKSILANIVAEKYKARIRALYDQWASYSDSNGDGTYDMTAAESQALKDAQAALAAEMLAERDNLASAFGWANSSSSQSSTYGSSTSMDQDTGDMIVGRSTAILESSIRVEGQNEQIITIMRMMNADTSALKAQGLDVAENVLMMRQDVSDISSNMSKLVVNTSHLSEMRDILDKIRKNTE